MCDFCDADGTDTKKEAVFKAKRLSEQLDYLSRKYGKIARGSIKPHTDEIKSVFEYSRMVVKQLVEDCL